MNSFKEILDNSTVRKYFEKDSESDIKRKLQAFLEIYPFVELYFSLKDEDKEKSFRDKNKEILRDLREDLTTINITIGQ